MNNGTEKQARLGALLKAGAAKRIRIKLARHVVNLNLINQELASYNVASLVKAAATQSSKEMRIKYAALKVQQAIEKQAIIGGLARLGMQGMGMLARGGAPAMAKAVDQNVVQPVVGAGRSMYNTAQNVGTRLGNASHALFGPMAQPQPAQMPPIRPVGMPQQRTM